MWRWQVPDPIPTGSYSMHYTIWLLYTVSPFSSKRTFLQITTTQWVFNSWHCFSRLLTLDGNSASWWSRSKEKRTKVAFFWKSRCCVGVWGLGPAFFLLARPCYLPCLHLRILWGATGYWVGASWTMANASTRLEKSRRKLWSVLWFAFQVRIFCIFEPAPRQNSARGACCASTGSSDSALQIVRTFFKYFLMLCVCKQPAGVGNAQWVCRGQWRAESSFQGLSTWK